MRENPVKNRLQAGETLLGTWLSIGDTLGAEVMACIGWDWLLIDMEHGPIPLSNATAMVSAVRAGGTTPFVRTAWNESSQIQRVLDLGAYGIIVPMVNTADDARAVVRDARFPPLGARSRGGVRANDEVLVFVQIETEEAVANAATIAAVEGIDGLFVGPNDLAASSGKRWPDVWDSDAAYMESIASIPAITKAAGKTPGIHARDPEMATQVTEMGYRFVGVAGDVVFLISAATAAVERARQHPRVS
jgi:4-hydroxy-2-oxoheptanedioate aldolase